MTIPDHLLPRVQSLIAALDAAGFGPSPEDLRTAPRLTMWQALLAHDRVPLLSGEVSGHPILGSGMITTSQLIAINLDAGWARTASRWYRLGDPLTCIADEVRAQLEAEDSKVGPMEFATPPGYRPISDLNRLQKLIETWAQGLRKLHAEHVTQSKT